MPASEPAPTFQRHVLRRVTASPVALDALERDDVLRTAPDEVLLLNHEPIDITDPDAIDVLDGGWSTALIDPDALLRSLSAMTTWSIGLERPALLQGLAAGVPIKVHLAGDGSARVLVPTPYADELRERWR